MMGMSMAKMPAARRAVDGAMVFGVIEMDQAGRENDG